MKNQKLLLVISLGLAIFFLLAGLIGALIKLINPQAILFALILLIGISFKSKRSWWRNALRQQTNEFFNNNTDKLIQNNSKHAASESLASIDKIINLIQDKVSTEALTQERERVEEELKRGDLVVVVFGTGSSGKTSLIRALLNEIVGNVGAAMGSTKRDNSYKLQLKGLQRGIKIIDTPGILETGEEGKQRAKLAIAKASTADLMLVVVDSDLRAGEREVIKSLSIAGKRLFIVLNKIDLRGEEEERRLLELLRARCKGFVDPSDIVPCTSAPQSIPRPGGRPYQPQPEIDILIKRLARVLHEDGDELIAENILLQCRSLGEKGKQLLRNQRLLKAKKIVDKYTWVSSGVVAVTPLPGIDLLGAAAVNAQMVIEIAKVFSIKITGIRAQELALSVGKTLTKLGIVKGSVSLISSTLSLSLPTLIISRIIQGVTAAWLTRVAGASFITYFGQDQDWGDGGIQEVVQRHYNLTKREESLNAFIDNAFKKFIKPLSKNNFKRLASRPMPREEEEA